MAPTVVFAQTTRVGDRYLETMGIPLLLGRGVTSDDGGGAEMVTVISKSLADQLEPGSATVIRTPSAPIGGRELLRRIPQWC